MDSMMLNNCLKNSMTLVKVYPGGDINSGHKGKSHTLDLQLLKQSEIKEWMVKVNNISKHRTTAIEENLYDAWNNFKMP